VWKPGFTITGTVKFDDSLLNIVPLTGLFEGNRVLAEVLIFGSLASIQVVINKRKSRGLTCPSYQSLLDRVHSGKISQAYSMKFFIASVFFPPWNTLE
jgi:hypothetical protein